MAESKIIHGVRVRNSILEGRFGRLTPVGPAFFTKHPKVVCLCDCGNYTIACYHDMRYGLWNSCGCYKKDNNPRTTHGLAKTVEHNTWVGMLSRCHNKNRRCYIRYGGRGITVHDSWLGRCGFEQFLKDMGPRPSPNHSIDRIDNDGNYEPNNCRLATRSQQVRNRNLGHFLEIDGVRKSYRGWSEVSGVETQTIYLRVKNGMTPRDAVFTPVRKRS